MFRPVVRTLTLLCALVAMAAAWAGWAGTASASRSQSTTFEAPRDLLDPALQAGALDQIGSLGARSLRVILYWHDVAPAPDSASRPAGDLTNPAAYDWSRYDGLIARAAARGWPVLLTVSGPVPRWATRAKKDTLTYPSPGAFRAFMTAVGRHYGGQVAKWAIWNEPNQPQFLLPQYVHGAPVSGRTYRALFLAAYDGLRAAGRGRDRLLMGETSPRGTSHVVAPLTFLRQSLCLSGGYVRRPGCSNLPADGYAQHAYTTRQGPFFTPPGPNDVTIGVLPRLVRALDRAGAAGAVRRGLPISLTEFGIQSTPDKLLGVSLAQQEEYRAISEKLAYDNPRVSSFSQYLLRDDDALSGFQSGLQFADGRPKPSQEGFRLSLVVTRTSRGVALWGHVRPARTGTTATIEVSDRGRAFRVLKSVKTNRSGYLTTSSSKHAGRRWRLRWSAPDGTVFRGAPIRAYRAP